MLRYEGSGMKACEARCIVSVSGGLFTFHFTSRDGCKYYRYSSDHLNYIRCIEFLHRPNRWGTNCLVGVQQVRNSALRQTIILSQSLGCRAHHMHPLPLAKRDHLHISKASLLHQLQAAYVQAPRLYL